MSEHFSLESCEVFASNAELHKDYRGPVYETSSIENYFHNLERTPSYNHSNLQNEFQDGSYWNGVFSTYPIVLAFLLGCTIFLLLSDVIFSWQSGRYRVLKAKTFSCVTGSTEVPKTGYDPKAEFFLLRVPIWARRFAIWFLFSLVFVLAVTSWIFMVIGEAHVYRGLGDASDSIGEIIIFLDALILLLEGMVGRLKGSHEYFAYYFSDCEREVMKMGNYSDINSIKSNTSSVMLEVYTIAIYELEQVIDISIWTRDSLKVTQDSADESQGASVLIIIFCALASVTLLIQSGPTLLVLCHLDKQAQPYYKYMRERADKCFATLKRKLSLMTCRQDPEVEKISARDDATQQAGDGSYTGLAGMMVPRAPWTSIVLALWIMLLWSLSIVCLHFSISMSDYCHDVDGNTAKFGTKYVVEHYFEDEWTEEMKAEMEAVVYDVLTYYTTCPSMEDAMTDADVAKEYGLYDVYGAEGYTLLTTWLNVSSVMNLANFDYPALNSTIAQLLQADDSVSGAVCAANTMNLDMLQTASALGNTAWPRSWNWDTTTCSEHFNISLQEDNRPPLAQSPPFAPRWSSPAHHETPTPTRSSSAAIKEIPQAEMTAVSDAWAMLYCDAGGDMGAFSMALQNMMASGDTDTVESLNATLQELQEIDEACCQSTYDELREVLYTIPMTCEVLDLLECYDINRLHVKIFHESMCEGVVARGLGYIGIGLLFLSLAFSLLLKLSSRLVYDYGMYAVIGWTLSCCKSGSVSQELPEWPESAFPAGSPHYMGETAACDMYDCAENSK